MAKQVKNDENKLCRKFFSVVCPLHSAIGPDENRRLSTGSTTVKETEKWQCNIPRADAVVYFGPVEVNISHVPIATCIARIFAELCKGILDIVRAGR